MPFTEIPVITRAATLRIWVWLLAATALGGRCLMCPALVGRCLMCPALAGRFPIRPALAVQM